MNTRFLGAFTKWLFICIVNVIKIAYIYIVHITLKKVVPAQMRRYDIIPWNVTLPDRASERANKKKNGFIQMMTGVWRKSAGHTLAIQFNYKLHDISWLTFNYDRTFDMVNFDRIFFAEKWKKIQIWKLYSKLSLAPAKKVVISTRPSLY